MVTVPNSVSKVVEKYNLTYLGEGNTRQVYLTPSKNYVIKFGNDWCNQSEAIAYERNREEFNGPCRFARCKYISLDGVDCLIMEYIKPETKSWRFLLDWTSNIDCHQVGYDKRGKLVAYDFA